MKKRMNSRGFIKGFFVLLVLLATAYAGISFGKPYYRYNTLRSHTKDLLLTEVGNIQSIRTKVLAEAAELKVPLKESDIQVTESQKVVRVKAAWSETVDFWGYYQKRLDFVIEEEL
jgi:hypothetical protein